MPALPLIDLPAGARVDRLRTRGALVAADLARAALFASLPLVWWLDILTLGQLYAAALPAGCATAFSDVGSQNVVPQLVGREGLVRANTAMVTLMAAANIAGRGAGGAPVAALTAPFAPTRPSTAYLASALRLTAIRSTPAPAPAARTPLTAQIREGLHPVRGRPAARPGTGPTLNNLGGAVLGGAVLGGAVLGTMLRMLFVRELGLPPAGSVGLLLGARPALRGGPWATGAPYC